MILIRPYYDRRSAGFTMVELVVVIGILGVLASLLLPALAGARLAARKAQCTSQLHQISQALVMYDIDHDRVYENYPDRITHLKDLGYVGDARVFVCPMDPTKATKNSSNKTTLKPGNASDNKSYWAERTWNTDTATRQQNSSYLYEFSTRTCQSYIKNASGQWEWSGSGFGDQALVGFYDEPHFDGQDADPTAGTVYIPPLDSYFAYTDWDFAGEGYLVIPANPQDVDRDKNGVITWQEAKFWQLENGDVYTTGYAAPGDLYVPASWSDEPWFNIGTGDATMQHGYPRTWLPILRCFWHMDNKRVDDETLEEVLNLAVDGNTFYSVPGWEQTAWKYGRQYLQSLEW